MLDLDYFKTINDHFGHPTGDAILVAVGKVLTERVRLGEVAARIGGDEFAMLLPNADEEGALAFARSVEEELDEPRLGASAWTMDDARGRQRRGRTARARVDQRRAGQRRGPRALPPQTGTRTLLSRVSVVVS